MNATTMPSGAGTDEQRFDIDELATAVAELLGGFGLPASDARVMADALLDADMGQIRTHGLRLLPAYLRRLAAGAINPLPQIKPLRQDGALTVLDGDDGFGQVVATRAMLSSLEVMAEHGVAVTVVRRSNHLGALGYPARLAADRGAFAFVVQNTRNIVLLPGGERPGVGNNPFALALPTGRSVPMVLDISCSIVAKNNIYRAAERGEQIEPGIAVDAAGQPTTDPHEALQGAVVAFGGHKGAGLAMFMGALAGILSGSAFGPDIVAPNDYSAPRDIGHFICLIDIHRLMDTSEYEQRIATYLGSIEASGPTVRFPGQRAGRARTDAREHGVLVPRYVLDDLQSIAGENTVRIDWPEPREDK